MRKTKFIVLLTIGSLLTFGLSGCKDYDDDISDLQNQINLVSSDLKDLKTKFPGKVATDVVAEGDGFRVKFTDGASDFVYTPKAGDAVSAEWKEGTLWVGGKDTGIPESVKDGGDTTTPATGFEYVVGEKTDAGYAFKYIKADGTEDTAKSFTIPFNDSASAGGISSIVFLPQVTLDGRPAIYAPSISVDTTGINKNQAAGAGGRDTLQGAVTMKFRLNPASTKKTDIKTLQIFASTLTELRAALPSGGENPATLKDENFEVENGILTITLDDITTVLDSAYSVTNAPAAQNGNDKPFLAAVVNTTVVSTYVPVVTEVIPYEQIFIGENRTARGYVRYGIEAAPGDYNYAGDPEFDTMEKPIAYSTTSGSANRGQDHVAYLDYKRTGHNKGEGVAKLEPSLFRIKPTTYKKVPVEGFNKVKWIYRLSSAGDKVIGRYNSTGTINSFVNRSTDAFALVQENGKTNLEVDEITGKKVYVRALNNDSILRFQKKDSVRVRVVADFSAYIIKKKDKHASKDADDRKSRLAHLWRDSTDAARVLDANVAISTINTTVGWATVSDPYYGNPLVKVIAELPLQDEREFTWVQGGDSIIGGRAYTGAGHAAAVARGFIDSTLYIALRDGAGPAKLSGSLAIVQGVEAADYIGRHRVVTLKDKDGKPSSDTLKVGMGHYAGGSRDSLRVSTGDNIPSAAKSPYTVKWSVERPDLPGVKYVASFKIELKNPTIKVQPIAEYWDGTTQISYGELFDPTTAASPTSRSVENPWLMRAYLNRALDLGNAKVDYEAVGQPTADTPLIVSHHKDAWGWGNPRSQLLGRHDIITDSRKDLDTKYGIVAWGQSGVVNAGGYLPQDGGTHDGKYFFLAQGQHNGVGGFSDSIMGFRAGHALRGADTLGIASDTVANYFMSNPIKTAVIAALTTEKNRNSIVYDPNKLAAVGEFPLEIVGITTSSSDYDAGFATYKVQFKNPLTFAMKAKVPLYTGNTDKHDVFTVDPDATTGYLVGTAVPGVSLAPSTTTEPYKPSQFIIGFNKPVADGYSELVEWGRLWPLTVNWGDKSVPADFSLNTKVFSVPYVTRWGETPRVPGGIQLDVTNP